MKDKTKSPAKAPAKSARAPKGISPRAATAEKSAEKAVAVEKKTKPAGAKTAKPAPKARSAKASAAKPEPAKSKKTAAPSVENEPPRTKEPKTAKPETRKARTRRSKTEPEANIFRVGARIVDPLGDTTDGEGRVYLGDADVDAVKGEPQSADSEIAAFRKETHIEASDATIEAGPGMEAAAEAMEARARNEAEQVVADAPIEDLSEQAAREPGKLERLQKILSQAGIASRRRAEEMITEGRVMVNGQVVTTLGSKADPARDHIRVDGKLLHGAERHRYFVLNKPRGYVTTVSDPEGRPTVMDLLPNSRERLYPVGRLDFQSEGLLLMTNDGELANLLTKAGSGVEKTYLVKVAGRPSEQDLERLLGGVTIEKGEQGSERVTTAPARVRQVREGENPWFEVVLIEGRNRELRKMFSAIGHFVEKIRRVGYGPLQLDVEPGKMRELSPDEVNVLRLAAEGKLKPRRLHADRLLPKDAGRAAEDRPQKHGGRGGRSFDRRSREDFAERGERKFGNREGKPFRPREDGETKREFRPRAQRDFRGRDSGSSQQGERRSFGKRDDRGFGRRESRPFKPRGERAGFGGPPRDGQRQGQPFGRDKPRFDRPRTDRPGFGGRGSETRQHNERGVRDGAKFGGAGKPFRGRGGFGGAKKPFGAGSGRDSDRGESRLFKARSERPRFDRGERKPFRASGERPRFERIEKPKYGKRGPEISAPENRQDQTQRGGFTKRGGGGGGKSFGKGAEFGSRPRSFGGSREGGRGGFRGKSEGGTKRSFSRPDGRRGGGNRG
jgi:23S rRNA pseudouridine2605 synthase